MTAIAVVLPPCTSADVPAHVRGSARHQTIPGDAPAEFMLEVRGAMVVAGIVPGAGVTSISRWWTPISVAELRGQL